MSVQITFLGGAGTVTGSKYLVRHNNHSLLLDCGLFQGYKLLRLRNWQPLPVQAAQVRSVVLTHAHIDHNGYLPLLARQGFHGSVFCTPATYDLCRILLPDSGFLQEEDASFANRHGFSKHAPAKPLYTRADAVRSLKLIKTVKMNRGFEPLFTVDLMTKDVELAEAFAREAGLDASLLDAVIAIYHEAQAEGLGGLDYSGLINASRTAEATP